MKILLISAFFYPHKGGSEKYAEELFTTLKKIDSSIEVDILTYNTEGTRLMESYKGLKIFRIPCFTIVKGQYYLPKPLHLIKTLRYLGKNKYDYLITQTRFFDPTWWGWLYAKIIGAIPVFIGHGTDYVIHNNHLVRLISRLIDMTIAPLSLRFYKHVIVISKATRDFYRRKLHVKNPILIYGGIHSDYFIPASLTPKPHNPIRILYIGRMIAAKGVTYLYDAFKEILDQIPTKKVELVFAGAGPIESQIKQSIASDNLQSKVRVLGEVSYEQVTSLLRESDIFVNPSFNEGLPRTVLEAAASGLLVIATDVGSTNEIINEHTGFLIPKADKEALKERLVKAIDNYSEYYQLRKGAIDHIRDNFDWNITAQKIYNVLANGKKD